jgi:putative chitinase
MSPSTLAAQIVSIRFVVTSAILLIFGISIPMIEVSAQPSSDVQLDAAALAGFSPRARADVVVAILTQWNLARSAGIVTPVRVQHFMAEMATETNGFLILEENLNYSKERLLQIFPTHFDPTSAALCAHNPICIANRAYGGRLGNVNDMDGWNYRGSGLLQLTGRSNYAAMEQEVGLPIVEKPQLARIAGPAFATAVSFWRSHRINAVADSDKIERVRNAVNGGLIGLDVAKMWRERARRFFGSDRTSKANLVPTPEEQVAINQVLLDLGVLAPGAEKSSSVEERQLAIKAFQMLNGLAATGFVDENTLYEITNPDRFRTR